MNQQLARGPERSTRCDCMFYKEWHPAAELSPFIKCIWVLERDYRGPFPDHEHLWADANGELILTRGSPYFLKNAGRKRVLPAAFVIGPFTRSFDLHSAGKTALVGVRFFPWGFFALSRQIVADLVDKILPAHAVFGVEIDALADRLAEADRVARVESVGEWLETRARQDRLRQCATLPIARRIVEQHGKLPIARLADEFSTTPRRLERLFRMETGLSPKQLSRIVRFNHAKQLIQDTPDIELADVAYAAGYSDQAHFSKTFKEMFGITPRTFKRQMVTALALFAETKPSVAFLQEK